MYTYFTIFGILFVAIFATVTNYIYDLFSINKVTNFFAPLGNDVWHNISALVLPTILWGYIELPMIGNLSLFWASLILNIFTQCCLMFVIKYGAYLLMGKKNNFINILAIWCSSIIGFILAYLIFMVSNTTGGMLLSILVALILMGGYALLIFYPPKIKFFKDSIN